MEHEDLLLTLAEIAVTLAALSGVAGVLGARAEETQMASFEIVLLRNVALIGMVVALFALLPLTFRGSPLGNVTTWRLCSALAVACSFAGYGLFVRRALQPLRSGAFSTRVFLLGLAFSLASSALLAWNVVAPSPGSPQRYVLALMAALALAAINFVVTALRTKPPAV